MDEKRKMWSERQKTLRGALMNTQDLEAGIKLFLEQHANDSCITNNAFCQLLISSPSS
jgi:hypothetical protein